VRKGERAASSPGGGKAARAIVRNLNFKATESELAAAFVRFGPLREVHIPTVSMPKHFNPAETKAQSRGFGFVQFLLANDALAATAAAEKTPVVVCGRAVTVAMAQAKKAYDANGGEKGNKDKAVTSGEAAENNGDEEKQDHEMDGEANENDEDEDEDDDMSDSDGSGVSDSEDDDDDDKDNDDEDDEEVDSIDEAADEEAERAAAAAAKEKLEAEIAEARAAKKKAREEAGAASKDVKEGRTVFVKSLPFDASEESLRHRWGHERCFLGAVLIFRFPPSLFQVLIYVGKVKTFEYDFNATLNIQGLLLSLHIRLLFSKHKPNSKQVRRIRRIGALFAGA